MAVPARRETRWPFPELAEWLESPMIGWRGFGQAIRIEDYQEDGRYIVRAELPDIDPAKDVEVTVEGGMLSIRAERREETKGKRYSEFRYGSLYRSVALPAGAKEDDITATYKNGVLEISVPVPEKKPSGRTITIEHVA